MIEQVTPPDPLHRQFVSPIPAIFAGSGDTNPEVGEFERHAADGRLSFVHNGQMVDAPHLARARAILIRAGITTSRINPDTDVS